MYINFLVFIMCAALAVWYGIKRKIGFCIFEVLAALINLPFAIKWLATLFA